MKKYRFLLQMICLLMANSIFAEGKQHLCVLLKSGTQINVAIEERPMITFDGTVMRVDDGDYQIANVRKWMIGDPEVIAQGIEDAKAGNAISYQNGILTVGKQTNVRAYNMAGVEMPVQVKNGQVDMTTWPQDVYVIKAGSETLKLRKR